MRTTLEFGEVKSSVFNKVLKAQPEENGGERSHILLDILLTQAFT